MQQNDGRRPAYSPVDELFHKLNDAQARYHLFPDPLVNQARTVVVGVSGGADSVCLVHLLAHVAEQWHLKLHVAHLDHNLRPEAAADAAFVKDLAAALQLPFHTARLPVGALTQQPGGLEAAARRARYAFLLRTTINVTPGDQVPCLVLAHHANDQAETVLLNLVRGSGLPGLSGMRWRNAMKLSDFDREIGGEDTTVAQRIVQVVRPFLQVRRTEIMAYLQTHQLIWCEDASNQDPKFLRNRIRHEVLPRLEQINANLVETLGHTAEILAGEAERLQRLDRQTLAALCLDPGFSVQTETAEPGRSNARIVLDLEKFLALGLADQRGVLRQAVALLQSGLQDTSFEQIDTLIWSVRAHSFAGGPHSLVHQLAWTVAGATPQSPARLSLHQQAALPFLPTHPYLDETWRKVVGVMPLPCQGQVAIDQGWVLQSEVIPRANLPSDWQQRGQPWRAYLDADQVGALALTTPRPGFQFAPLGLAGQHKALGDFFTDRKIPVSLRPGWPLLLDQVTNTLLWVCGLAPAYTARVTALTRQVLCLAWVK